MSPPVSKNYVARLRDELAARLPDCDAALIDLYTLLAMTFGTAVDGAMVHNAWSVWCNRTNPGHRSLIAYPYLKPDVQALDEPYVDAIRETVRADYEAMVAAHAARGGTDA